MAEIISLRDYRTNHALALTYAPTEAQRNCPRHAFTDSECTLHGCHDCPETLYERELRAGRASGVWTILGWAAVAWILIGSAGVIINQAAANWHNYNIAHEKV